MFGQVISGYDEVVKKIEGAETGMMDRPKNECTIVDCGELEKE